MIPGEERGGVEKLARIIDGAFSSSFNSEANHNEVVAIKSAMTGHFIFIENDGLVRICLLRHDDQKLFDDFGVFPVDMTNLLSDKDLFDAILK